MMMRLSSLIEHIRHGKAGQHGQNQEPESTTMSIIIFLHDPKQQGTHLRSTVRNVNPSKRERTYSVIDFHGVQSQRGDARCDAEYTSSCQHYIGHTRQGGSFIGYIAITVRRTDSASLADSDASVRNWQVSTFLDSSI